MAAVFIGHWPINKEVNYGNSSQEGISSTVLSTDLVDAIEEKKSLFQQLTLDWAISNLRSYPWRHESVEAYGILAAELLLKRTTASAAARTYEMFITKYRTPLHLAKATEEELIEDLRPLGLYIQRAKMIRKLAQYLLDCENGSIPDSLDRLLRVPGLGEYSARAILSFGYDLPIAVLDSNVQRIICRVFRNALMVQIKQRQLQEIADLLLPTASHRPYNFALLDIGALVCRYVSPLCKECPLLSTCDFYQAGLSTERTKRMGQLRKVRMSKGVSLAQLSKLARVSKLTIINIEANRTKPTLKTIAKLALALGVEPDTLNKP